MLRRKCKSIPSTTCSEYERSRPWAAYVCARPVSVFWVNLMSEEKNRTISNKRCYSILLNLTRTYLHVDSLTRSCPCRLVGRGIQIKALIVGHLIACSNASGNKSLVYFFFWPSRPAVTIPWKSRPWVGNRRTWDGQARAHARVPTFMVLCRGNVHEVQPWWASHLNFKKDFTRVRRAGGQTGRLNRPDQTRPDGQEDGAARDGLGF